MPDVTYVPSASELRKWAGHPAESGYVPVHPTTLRALADELDRLNMFAAVLNQQGRDELNRLLK